MVIFHGGEDVVIYLKPDCVAMSLSELCKNTGSSGHSRPVETLRMILGAVCLHKANTPDDANAKSALRTTDVDLFCFSN